MPGKHDTKKGDKELKQRQLLNDYLANLHEKYLADNPLIKLSYSSFCGLKLSNFMTIKCSERKTCLCERHQNMALKLRLMKVITTTNPDAFIRTYDDETLENIFQKIAAREISLRQWKRADVVEKEKYYSLFKECCSSLFFFILF